MLSTDRLADALTEQTRRVVQLTSGAEPARQVPTCPEWNLRLLLAHIGQAHRFAADVVRRQVSEPGELTAPADFPVPDEASELGAWLVDGAGELTDALRTVGAEQPVWNFTGDGQIAGFWLRRMVHETVVHRFDAALTLDEPYSVDAELAADGISEWLALVTAPGAAAARPEAAAQLRGQGETLHLHATGSPGLGTAGEWLIRLDPDAVTWQHAHQKADTAVRGPAGDLFLALLGRIPSADERIEVLGDAALFDHWRRHATF